MIPSVSFRDLKRLESSRGVGYLCLIASAIAPSFVVIALFDSSAKGNVLFSVLLAAAIGITVTAMFSALRLLAIRVESDEVEDSQGIRALAVGVGTSLSTQILAGLATGLSPQHANVRTYVGLVAVFSVWPVLSTFWDANRGMKRQVAARKTQELPSGTDTDGNR